MANIFIDVVCIIYNIEVYIVYINIRYGIEIQSITLDKFLLFEPSHPPSPAHRWKIYLYSCTYLYVILVLMYRSTSTCDNRVFSF